MSPITTTIRWQADELARVKAAAKKIGLPVALFIKSLALGKVNEEEIDEQELYSPELTSELSRAQGDALSNKDITAFHSQKDFLASLKKCHNL